MRRATAVALALASALTSAAPSARPADGPELPPAPVRALPGWAPAAGVLVAWPLSVPDLLLTTIADGDRLLLLADPERVEEARAHALGLGLAPDAFDVLPSSVASVWPRDWGPHQLFDAAGRLSLVDHDFRGYPHYPRDYVAVPAGEPVDHAAAGVGWYRPGAGDDLVVDELAALLGFTSRDARARLTGGNLLLDGEGRAFCTEALLVENAEAAATDPGDPSLDEAALRARVAAVLGVDDLVVLENTEPQGIQHIDCWFKPLPGGRLLVKRPPAGHAEEAPIERNLARLAALEAPTGGPYEVFRVDCGPVPERRWTAQEGDPAEAPLAAYTNSLLLGRRVLVPVFGVEGDARALEQWRAALPGHEVVGIPYPRQPRSRPDGAPPEAAPDGAPARSSWYSYDALHCRARVVFDAAMVDLGTPRLARTQDGATLCVVRIAARSGVGLAGPPQLRWRADPGQPWRAIDLTPLAPTAQGTLWSGRAPAEAVEVWLRAEDAAGRSASWPPAGSDGPFRLR